MSKRKVKLTEKDLRNIVKRVIKEEKPEKGGYTGPASYSNKKDVKIAIGELEAAIDNVAGRFKEELGLLEDKVEIDDIPQKHYDSFIGQLYQARKEVNEINDTIDMLEDITDRMIDQK